MDKRRVAVSEAVGAVAIYSAAVFLHFAFGLSGRSALGMLFGAVNESVWEHVKIFSIAYTGWALIQLCWLKVPFKQYVVAKCAGLYTLMALIIGSFYLYTAFTGRAIFQVDIVTSALFTVFAQWLSFRLITGENRIRDYYMPALMLLGLYYLMFFSFTVSPPRIGLFRDPLSGDYGIPGRKQ